MIADLTLMQERYSITDYWCRTCFWSPRRIFENFTSIDVDHEEDEFMAPCPKCEAMNPIGLEKRKDADTKSDTLFDELLAEMAKSMTEIISLINHHEFEEKYAEQIAHWEEPERELRDLLIYWPQVDFMRRRIE